MASFFMDVCFKVASSCAVKTCKLREDRMHVVLLRLAEGHALPVDNGQINDHEWQK
jgi:hypothetical protein